MGKGDRRTRKGKIWNGSYGARRPRNESTTGAGAAQSPGQPGQPIRPGRPGVRPPK